MFPNQTIVYLVSLPKGMILIQKIFISKYYFYLGKSIGQQCTLDPECAIGDNYDIDSEFKQHLTPIKCTANKTGSTNTCQCLDTSVQVAVAIASVDACLPKGILTLKIQKF